MYALILVKTAEATYNELKRKAEVSLRSREAKSKTKATKDEGLFKQVSKALDFLRADPTHPGLQTHKFSGYTNPYDKKQPVFESYVQNKTPGAYRIFWCYGPKAKQVTVIAITPHP